MSVGEPQDAPPAILAETVAAHAIEWNRYPPAIGTPEFRQAAQGYLARRYPVTRGASTAGCRNLAGHEHARGPRSRCDDRDQPVATRARRDDAESVLPGMPGVAALMAGAEPRYLAHSGFPEFAPDFTALDAAMLDRRSISNPRSPANPDGNVVGAETMRWRSRRHAGTTSSSSTSATRSSTTALRRPARSMSSAAMDASDRWLDNALVLHSLSKRSSAAGLCWCFVGAATALRRR
jgi:N-succinyldiaminopimelate aminotransferase